MPQSRRQPRPRPARPAAETPPHPAPSNPQQPGAFTASVQLRIPEEYAGTPLAYANATLVSLTQNDITIHFSYYTLPVIGAPPAPEEVRVVTATPAISVTIPPAVARALIDQLQQQLENQAAIAFRPAAP
jgi:hypothetical protein